MSYDLSAVEVLTSVEECLVGGFSKSFSNSFHSDDLETQSNNCLGGNCAVECETQQNHNCNTIAGCSV